MTSIDELAELNFAARDPQFQNPDAYDKDAWLETMEEAASHIDEAIMALQQANDIHEFRTADEIAFHLRKAFNILEDER